MTSVADAFQAGAEDARGLSVAANSVRAAAQQMHLTPAQLDEARAIGDRTRKEQGLPPQVESVPAVTAAVAAMKGTKRSEGKGGDRLPKRLRPGRVHASRGKR